MKRTFILVSTEFKGQVLFEFENDLLIRFDASEAELNEAQRIYMLKKLPRSLDLLQKVLGGSKTARLQEQKKSGVTFEDFWGKYDEKVRSSKKKTERRWRQMSQTQRDRAYNHIDVYFKNIQPGVAKKYAETYLNAELWNN